MGSRREGGKTAGLSGGSGCSNCGGMRERVRVRGRVGVRVRVRVRVTVRVRVNLRRYEREGLVLDVEGAEELDRLLG